MAWQPAVSTAQVADPLPLDRELKGIVVSSKGWLHRVADPLPLDRELKAVLLRQRLQALAVLLQTHSR